MGLSAKQRYYNNLAKKGKITKAQAASFGVSEKDKKKSSSKSSSSSVSNPYSKYQSMDWGSAAEAFKRDRGLSSDSDLTGSDFDLAMNYKYNQPNYNTLLSQREQAANAAKNNTGGKVFGASTSKSSSDLSNRNLQYKADNSTDSGWRKALSAGLSLAKYAIPGAYGISKGLEKLNLDLTNTLGIPTARAAMSEEDYAGTSSNPASRLNESFGTGGKPMQERITNITKHEQDLVAAGFDPNIASILAGSSKIQNDNGTTGTGINYNKTSSDNNNDSGDDNDRRTSSRRVTNPIFQPKTPSISDILKVKGGSPQSRPDFSAGQTTDKTQRRFLGNGLLSKGTYGNGSGDYGMEGTFGTNQMSEEDNLLNTLLGIPTAKAAEMQTNLFNQPNTDNLGRPYTGYSAQNGGMSTRYGVDTPPTFTPKNTLNEDYESDATGGYKPQATGGSGSGGVAQQYSQQGENPQEKYYKEAIKNQKQIRNETLKSLKKQLEATLEALNSEYDESQESGTNALNKQKQEDLQALNARFSFGLNQDPNSEQSIQYAQRTSNDYAGKLADFLQKLSTSRMKDVNSARSTYDQNKSSAIQNYYSQKSSAQEKLAQLMASLEEARINNAKKLSSAGTTAESKKQAAIMKLLNQAANMPSGGREYAQQIANIQGLGDISGYTPNGWENAYNPNFGQSKPSNVVSIGNGYVLDKDTGDVYQAYE